VFRHACKMGLEGIVSKRLGSRLHVWPFAGLVEVQEPGGARGETRGGRGLGAMRHGLARTISQAFTATPCKKVQPLIFKVFKADAYIDYDSADIVCSECKTVIATLHSDRSN
jgi:hypothetical protein